MSSYVYMKILESRPGRYDRGIACLSFGQANRIKRRIADELVEPEMRVLDVGCGTGTLAVLVAKTGAHATGFDVSGGMLAVAAGKAEAQGLAEEVELHEMGLAGLERFPRRCFDLVTATLVFSELSADEQQYALRHAHRVLRPGGRLALADEVRPRCLWKRVLHGAIRMPVAVLTFVLTQTTTRAVEGLEDRVREAGFRIETAERSRLESFLYLVALKEEA